MKSVAGVDVKLACGAENACLGPLELLVLQATPFCNLNCSYCYLPNRDDRSKMDLPIIARAIERILEAGLVRDEFTVVWHAGEPLVPGIEYYDRAIECIADKLPSDIRVNHSFQTNGVLIDHHWCDFFKRHSIRLGLSVDGPEAIHDRYRLTRNGKGTHRQVSRALHLLREQGIDYHVIAVLTEHSIHHPELLFDYFASLGIGYLCLNVEEIEGVNLQSTILDQDQYSIYRQFLYRFHAHREQFDSKMWVREIDSVIGSIMGCKLEAEAADPRPQEATPFKVLNVDVNGNFSTFSPELLGIKSALYGDFRLGNLVESSIGDCLASTHYRLIAGAVAQGVQRCRDECDYFKLCGGGSPSNKLAETGRLDSSETAYCRLQKKACIDTAIAILESDIGLTNDSNRGLSNE